MKTLGTESIAVVHVLLLALAAFIVNTSEFIPVALITDIAESFDASFATVGLMITIYAWIVAIFSLPLMLITSRIERKKLLMLIFALFIICQLLSGLAWNYTVLVIARTGVAIAHALFWSITAALAMRLAPVNRKTKALAYIAMGTTLATVLGLPIGRLINQMFGWRQTFYVIGAVSAVVMIALYVLLPKLPSQNSGNIKSLPIILKRPILIICYLLILLIATAHFIAFSYIEPFANKIVHLNDNEVTLLLLIYGGFGFIGSLIFARLYARWPNQFLLCTVILILLSLAFLKLFSGNTFIWFGLCGIWAMAFTCFALSTQIRVLSLAPDATDVASSIQSAIFNVGIGSGALLGGLVITHLGIQYIAYVGLIFAVLGLLLLIWRFIFFKGK